MSNSFYIKTEVIINKLLELEYEREKSKDPQHKLILDSKISVLNEILKPVKLIE